MKNEQSSILSTTEKINLHPIMAAHTMTIHDVVQTLSTNSLDGLGSTEASCRLSRFGRNELRESTGVPSIAIFIRQSVNAMTLVLVMALGSSFGIGSYVEGCVVTAVVVLNVVVGFIQEYRAEQTMSSLRSLSSPTATVVRDGERVVLPSAEVVPGDLLELKVGDTVPADTRLTETFNLETDEAALTGESFPTAKDADLLFGAEISTSDRRNIAYSSTFVTKGRASGIVVATGMQTEIGQLAAALAGKKQGTRPVKHQDGPMQPHRHFQAFFLTAYDWAGRFLGFNIGTPLQRKLSKMAIGLFGAAIVCAIIVLAVNNFSGNREVVIYAIATGVSIIPSSLVVVLTITMAVGTRRMVERHALIRRLSSLEALGAVTNICSDKTGTLTQGKMVATQAWIPGLGTYWLDPSADPIDPTIGQAYHSPQPPSVLKSKQSVDEQHKARFDADINQDLGSFLDVASLANVALVHKNAENLWVARGDPTEVALQVFASRFNRNRIVLTTGDDALWTHVAELSFDSDIKMMTTIYKGRESPRYHIFTKGAVERVLGCCANCSLNGPGIVEMTPSQEETIHKEVNALTSKGLRVLALASRSTSPRQDEGSEQGWKRSSVEKSLTFRGLIGIYDPPRPESKSAVRQCQEAGIAVHMATGDHPDTARAIAAQVGILPGSFHHLPVDVAKTMVMTAADFDLMSEKQVDDLAAFPRVIARCTPTTKVRVIEALHRRQRFAAMTGDGVNDSPALKHADIGIAMGKTGSDVAKSASDIVLTDDNFATILHAIEEGRRLFDNIQKFVLHVLATNIAQTCTLLIGLAFRDRTGLSVFPLSPVEIMWIIVATSGAPEMGLGMEKAEPDIMLRPPRSNGSELFTLESVADLTVYGILMAALCLSSFTLVMFNFGDGNLGERCNSAYSRQCETVFRARATTFVSMTWFALFLAWELVDRRRSLFRRQSTGNKCSNQLVQNVWGNQFLFWAIVAGFVTVFPTLYIPVISHKVFKHGGITWEWGIVVSESVVFFLAIESWKWCKRVYFRRRNGRTQERHSATDPMLLPEQRDIAPDKDLEKRNATQPLDEDKASR